MSLIECSRLVFVSSLTSLTESSVDSANPTLKAGNDFEPIQQLRRTNAAVILLFLANAALYPEPIMDPWFNAQVPVNRSVEVGPYMLYAAHQPVSVLGCTDQTEICNPALGGDNNCTPISTLDDLSTELQLNSRQASVLSRFHGPLLNSIAAMAQVGEDGNLLASSLTSYWFSAKLPDYQWILEVQHWFAMIFIEMQLNVIEYVTGMNDPSYDHWLKPPTPNDEWMCANQIVQRNDYMSFSVLGIAIILCSGGLLMLVNISLSTVWPRLRRDKRSALQEYRDEEWKSTELLKLQQIADNRNSAKQSKAESVQDAESGRSFGSNTDKTVVATVVDQRRDSVKSSATAINLELQPDDFPPKELARLLSRLP